jgi:hypothetical protein
VIIICLISDNVKVKVQNIVCADIFAVLQRF